MGKIKQIPHRAKVHLLEDSLKTLEDKVKFIMKNTDKEIFNQTSMQEADSKWVTLQDLWDEQNEKHLGKELIKEFIKPTVKECPIPNCICKTDGIHFTVNKFGNTYIIEPTVKEYPCKCDCHKEMTKEELYPDDRPIANCGLCCLDKPTVKECEHDWVDMGANYECFLCDKKKDKPTDKSEKIEEIISDFCRLGIKLDLEIEDGYIIKNWLRDKLKSL